MGLTLLGLVGTGIILYGMYILGLRKRWGFLLMAVGNFVWLYVAAERVPFQLDLVITSAAFAGLSIRNWIVLGRDTIKNGLV
jgi:hypothetical protein